MYFRYLDELENSFNSLIKTSYLQTNQSQSAQSAFNLFSQSQISMKFCIYTALSAFVLLIWRHSFYKWIMLFFVLAFIFEYEQQTLDNQLNVDHLTRDYLQLCGNQNVSTSWFQSFWSSSSETNPKCIRMRKEINQAVHPFEVPFQFVKRIVHTFFKGTGDAVGSELYAFLNKFSTMQYISIITITGITLPIGFYYSSFFIASCNLWLYQMFKSKLTTSSSHSSSTPNYIPLDSNRPNVRKLTSSVHRNRIFYNPSHVRHLHLHSQPKVRRKICSTRSLKSA